MRASLARNLTYEYSTPARRTCLGGDQSSFFLADEAGQCATVLLTLIHHQSSPMKISWLISSALAFLAIAEEIGQVLIGQTRHKAGSTDRDHDGSICLRLPLTNLDNEQCASIEQSVQHLIVLIHQCG
jgi:hypothetical protein